MKEKPCAASKPHNKQDCVKNSDEEKIPGQWVSIKWARSLVAALVLLLLLLAAAFYMPRSTGNTNYTQAQPAMHGSREAANTAGPCSIGGDCEIVCKDINDGITEPGHVAAAFVMSNQSGCGNTPEVASLRFVGCTFPNSKLSVGWLPLKKSIKHLTIYDSTFCTIEDGAFSNVVFTTEARLTMDKFTIPRLSKGMLLGVKGMKALELRVNDFLVSVEEDFLEPVTESLKTIQLENMGRISNETLKNITGSNTYLTNVEELVIRYNPYIGHLGANIFLRMPVLKKLDLTGNGIKSIDTNTFLNIKNSIELIYLLQNSLTTLNEGTFDGLTSAIQRKIWFHIYLRDNPWRCDCSLLWLQDMMRRQNETFMDDPLCDSPTDVYREPLKDAAMCGWETTPSPTTTQATTVTPDSTKPSTVGSTTTDHSTTGTTTTPTNPTTITQSSTSTSTTEPSTTVSSTTEPTTTPPTTVTPDSTKPSTVDSTTTDQSPTNPTTISPTTTTQSSTSTSTTEPSTTVSSTTEPTTTPPTTVTPDSTKPSTVDSTTTDQSPVNSTTISPTTTTKSSTSTSTTEPSTTVSSTTTEPNNKTTITVECTDLSQPMNLPKTRILSLEGSRTYESVPVKRRLMTTMTFNQVDFQVKETDDGVVVAYIGNTIGTLLRIDSTDKLNYSCYTNATGNVMYRNLQPSSSYTFCLLTEETLDAYLYNCRALTTLPIPKERTWLAREDRFAALGVGVVVVLLCGLVCSAIVFVVVRRHPTLLKGNKRVVVVKHRTVDVMVLPKQKRKTSIYRGGGVNEQQQTYNNNNNNNTAEYLRTYAHSVSQMSTITGRSSSTSYVSAVEPTQMQLMQWRIERMKAKVRRMFNENSAGMTTDTPPPLPPHPLRRQSSTLYTYRPSNETGYSSYSA